MAHRLFLDTNAVVDLFSNQQTSRSQAMRDIVRACVGTGSSFIIAATTVKDVSYLIEHGAWFKRIVPDVAKRRALSLAAREFMLRQCEVQAVDQAICMAAHLDSVEPDYDDAVIAACAAAAQADLIISSDAAAFQHAAVPKMTPEQCTEFFKRSQG